MDYAFFLRYKPDEARLTPSRRTDARPTFHDERCLRCQSATPQMSPPISLCSGESDIPSMTLKVYRKRKEVSERKSSPSQAPEPLTSLHADVDRIFFRGQSSCLGGSQHVLRVPRKAFHRWGSLNFIRCHNCCLSLTRRSFAI